MQTINRRSLITSGLGIGGLLATSGSHALGTVILPDKELVLKSAYLESKAYFENWFKHTMMNTFGRENINPWDFKENLGPYASKKGETGLTVVWNGYELKEKYKVDIGYGFHYHSGNHYYGPKNIQTEWFSQANISIEEYQQIEKIFNP